MGIEISKELKYNEKVKKIYVTELKRKYEMSNKKNNVKNTYKNKVKKQNNRLTGIFENHIRGFAFVMLDEGCEIDVDGEIYNKVFVSPLDIKDAMYGDRVEVDLLPEHLWRNNPEGIVTFVIERNYKEIVGIFQKSKRFGFVVPEDPKIQQDIYIPGKFTSGAKDGDIVVAKLAKYPTATKRAEGVVAHIIARKNEPYGDIKALIRQNGMRETFPSSVMAEAKAIERQGIKEEDMNFRKDLRNIYTATIDGADSKDFDDAISIKKNDDDTYTLWVHIADVAHYVNEGSPLDEEALKRGNSVYVINQVVPMLPKELSNGICSLNPHENRLTLTCEMKINKKGEVIEHDIYESIICSDDRLVYDDVSDVLEQKTVGGKNSKKLFEMLELASLLNAKRVKRGSIDFNVDEVSIVLDKDGKAIEVRPVERRVANRIIEEFMLRANETIAEHFFWLEIPFVYRVHEKPDADSIANLRKFLSSIGIHLHGDMEDIKPYEISNVLKKLQGSPKEMSVNAIILRSMQKAEYDTECKGHFGLAMKYYTHFTSPIRRYSDLLIHRIIKKCINGGLNVSDIEHFKKVCEKVASHTSKTERLAIDVERDVEKYKMTEYMQDYIGHKFVGIISGVTEYGIYVRLANGIEGMVPLRTMHNDYFVYEREHYRVIGERSRKIYALGDTVKIKVKDAKPDVREIDFVLA